MLRFLTICLPAAAVVGGGIYAAQDRAILAQIGLAPGRGELHAIAAPRHPAPRRPAGIRQGGPVCYDVPLWPADVGPLVGWPGYSSPPYSHPGAFAGVPVGGYGESPFLVAGAAPVSVFPVSDYDRTVYDTVTPVGDTPGRDKPTPVPEPMSLALFLVGLGGLWVVKGRRV